jgi:membrane protein DedA with SNARE-associated domain
LLGTVLWTIPFIVGGYYAGKVFHINPDYIPFAGLVFFILFLLYVILNFLKKKKKESIE